MTTDEKKALKGYTEQGLGLVLDAAHDMVKRAASLLHGIRPIGTAPYIADSARKREADRCLAEAEELIARVREVLP